MTKRTLLLKPERKRGKQAPPAPETADEFLAAGVDYEEAGEKWRAGDAAKSCRFFIRAIDTYQAGLNRFPNSFDLAYNSSTVNRARIQYDLSQQPRLLAHLPTSLRGLLQAALASHRYALNLGPDDANTLFNTGQVLTSISELIQAENSPSNREDALHMLEEAFQLFGRCLEEQEQQYASQDQIVAPAVSTAVASSSTTPSAGKPSAVDGSLKDEQWASIIEPVTIGTLVDTATAQIQTLTAMLPLLSLTGTEFLARTELMALGALQKAASIGSFSKQQQESNISDDDVALPLARANLLAGLADASFRAGMLSSAEYSSAITAAFDFPGSTSVQTMCDLADVDITLNVSFAALLAGALPVSESNAQQTPASIAPLRWLHLTRALEVLTSVSKLPVNDQGTLTFSMHGIHARRAECELLRARLAEAEQGAYEAAVKNRNVLVTNAETYYRGASKLAAAEGVDGENLQVRERVCAALTGKMKGIEECVKEKGGRERVERVVMEMMEEGLLKDVNGVFGS